MAGAHGAPPATVMLASARASPVPQPPEEWVNPHDPEAEITRMKDGRTALAYKAEHAVDLDTGAIVAVTSIVFVSMGISRFGVPARLVTMWGVAGSWRLGLKRRIQAIVMTSLKSLTHS
jgi:hypothetical protein